MSDPLLTIPEAAAILGMTERKVSRYCRRGWIQGAVKVSGSWRIPEPIRLLARTRGRPRKLTADQVQALRARHRAGDSAQRLAEIYGVSERSIRRYAQGDGQTKDELRMEIRQRFRDGETLAGLAAAYDLSERTVHRYLRGGSDGG